ncbi:unnamed protein product [Camellia sinensis]
MHFFFTAMLFVYGRILNQRLANTITSEKFFYHLVSGFIKYYMVTCYFLYVAGCAWRKLNVQRVLDESTKNHVKMRSKEAKKKLRPRKY